jgi:hypothetical protein
LNSFQALATLDSLEGAKSEDFVQSLHNILLLQEEVIDKCFLVKCHRVPVIFDAMGHDNTTVRLAALELCVRLLVRVQGGVENHIRYNQLHLLQVSASLNFVISKIQIHQVGLVDALQASLQAPTPAVRLKVAALLRILISSKDRDVISLVLASGCNRLFSQVMKLHHFSFEHSALRVCLCNQVSQIAPDPNSRAENLEHCSVTSYVGLVHSFLSVHTSMLRRDACRNLSKMGAISALASSLPFLFAQLKRVGQTSMNSQSERVFAEQINASCEEISQIAVWCSLGDLVSKKSLLHEAFFSSLGLALQVFGGIYI